MTTKQMGRDVSLLCDFDGEGYEVIAYAKDCAVDAQCDILEFTSPLSGRGKRHRAGRYSWTVKIDTLIADSSQPAKLLEILKNGVPVLLKMDVQLPYSGGKHSLQGSALAQSWAYGAPLQGTATFNASFIGDGELNLTPTSSRPPIVRP